MKLIQIVYGCLNFLVSSVAVSFTRLPKSGKAKPDFMSPEFVTAHQRANNERFYESTKVLGMLFRDIPVEVIEEDTMKSLRRQHRGDQRGRAGLDEEGCLTRSIQQLLIDSLDWQIGEEKPWLQPMAILAHGFGEEYWKICRLNTLGRSMTALSEAEAFVGVIAASCPDRRLKRETVTRLETQTGELFGMLKEEIVGQEAQEEGLEEWMSGLGLEEDGRDDEHATRRDVVGRAWACWKLACRATVFDGEASQKDGILQPKWFGMRSFGMIALELLLNELMIYQDLSFLN